MWKSVTELIGNRAWGIIITKDKFSVSNRVKSQGVNDRGLVMLIY